MQEVVGDQPQREQPSVKFHIAFAVTREHRRGQIGNAILSRWPPSTVSILDLTLSRMEKRAAVAIRVDDGDVEVDVVSTHLALGDRTRRRQVESLLSHPRLGERPTLLLGDMNAWRSSRATSTLESNLGSHNNRKWPASFPAWRPMLALDPPLMIAPRRAARPMPPTIARGCAGGDAAGPRHNDYRDGRACVACDEEREARAHQGEEYQVAREAVRRLLDGAPGIFRHARPLQ